jgi:hypothetical protein
MIFSVKAELTYAKFAIVSCVLTTGQLSGQRTGSLKFGHAVEEPARITTGNSRPLYAWVVVMRVRRQKRHDDGEDCHLKQLNRTTLLRSNV